MPATLNTAPYSLAEMMRRTPRNIQSNADDTRISKAKKIIDKDTGQPVVLSVIYATHDANGNPVREKREHRCYIMGLEGPSKPINESKAKLSCDCEWFMYVCEYALSRKGNADIIFSNGKPARVTNPNNRPQLCKHLFHLAETLIQRGM